MTLTRLPMHPIEPIFINRWSPRAFDAAVLPKADLLTILEAARWAPSAFNIQPWRFLYSNRDDAYWQEHLSLLDDFNQSWAHHASALVFILSDTLIQNDTSSSSKKSHYNSFDAGASWAQLALQSTAMGYQAHAMAGIHHQKIKERLSIPDRFQVEVAVAIGKQATSSTLPKELQDREQPSQRLEMNEIAYAGSFPQ